MNAEPLMKFKSHIDGKNADVTIYVDRIEWAQSGAVSLTRLAGGALTAGTSLLKTGVRKGGGTEMIPVKSMSSVTTGRDGIRFHKVSVICSGNTVDFRVDKADAEAAKTLLTQLILGSHPAQQSAGSGPAAPQSPPTPSAPQPGIADELTKLAALREAGLLTEDEFNAQKAKLLG